MKIRIFSPGRFPKGSLSKSSGKSSGNSAYREIFEEYAKRLRFEVELFEIDAKSSKTLDSVSQKNEEEKLILEHLAHLGSNLGKKSHNKNLPKFIILDERAKQLSSIEFAQMISSLQNQGESELNFVIGGACGLSENLKKTASNKISLGLMTFPHLMVRCILIEQLYRAFSIIDNHPYHRQ